MGLTIHYSGIFDKDASLTAFIGEVKDIAMTFNWPHKIFEETFPSRAFDDRYDDKIYGACFTPPDCETVWLSFLSNRRLSSPSNLTFYGKSDDDDEKKYLYMLSVKTQFAGVEVHKFVIHLLKYLNQKYFSEFNVHDEGEYWETANEKLLDENFKRYTGLLNSFRTALETYPLREGETLESYFERLHKYVNDNFRKSG